MIGNYSNKIDSKGRITIPSKFRNELGEVIVASYGFENSIELRTLSEFKKWSDLLIDKGNFVKSARELQRIILGQSFDIKVDKAGRILMPKALLKLAQIENEVVIVGIGDKLEIHSSNNWEKHISDNQQNDKSIEQLAEELYNKGE